MYTQATYRIEANRLKNQMRDLVHLTYEERMLLIELLENSIATKETYELCEKIQAYND